MRVGNRLRRGMQTFRGVGLMLGWGIALSASAFQFTLSPESAPMPWTHWQQMPLRTAAMRDAGLAGGDGFQMVFGLAYAPSDPQRAYASIDVAQVWRSDDGGASWRRAHKGFRVIGGLDLAVDPVQRDIVLIAGGEGRFSATDGVYRTVNGGDSWERVLAASYYKLDGPRCGSFFWFDPSSASNGASQVVYAADQGGQGVFRSHNGGASWQNIAVGGLGLIYDFQRHPFRDEFWVSTDGGLYVLRPQGGGYGKTLIDPASAGLPVEPSNTATRIQFNTGNSNVVYALCGVAGFYKSTNGGSSFSVRKSGIPSGIAGKKVASSLDCNPLNPNWLILCHHEIGYGNFMSFNGGETWSTFSNVDNAGLLTAMDSEGKFDSFYVAHRAAFHPSDPLQALIPGRMWEMEKTVDGGASWQFSGNGFCGARVGLGKTSFHFPDARRNEITLFCIDYGPYRSDDGGSTFRTLNPLRVNGARTTPVGAVHPDDPNVIVCASGGWAEQNLIRSSNGGASWSVVDANPVKYRYCAFHPQHASIVYAENRRSDDAGLTWTVLSHAVGDVYPLNGDLVYGYEKSGSATQIYRSHDRGASWSAWGPPIPATGVQEIAVDPTDPDRLYITSTGSGLYILDDGVLTVRNASSGLPVDWFGDYAFRNIAVHPGDPSRIYLSRNNTLKGHTDGVYRSLDRGMTWSNITGNLGPELTVWAIGVDARHDRVYLGTSHGTWFTAGGVGMPQANVLLAGWDGVESTTISSNRVADVAIGGVEATQQWSDSGTLGSHWTAVNAGSVDGTFGSLATGASTEAVFQKGAFMSKVMTPTYVDFIIENHSAFSYELTSFCFDAWRMNNQAVNGYTLGLVGGDLPLMEAIGSGSFVAKGATPVFGAADYDDINVSLAPLPNRLLEPGMRVVFRLRFPAATGTTNVYLDNVAVLGVEAP